MRIRNFKVCGKKQSYLSLNFCGICFGETKENQENPHWGLSLKFSGICFGETKENQESPHWGLSLKYSGISFGETKENQENPHWGLSLKFSGICFGETKENQENPHCGLHILSPGTCLNPRPPHSTEKFGVVLCVLLRLSKLKICWNLFALVRLTSSRLWELTGFRDWTHI